MSRKNGNDNAGDLDIGTLSGQPWEAAHILRGPVAAAGFKTCIFPLLFFKRFSDVYDEEYSKALEESDGDVEFAQFPENHRFQVSEGCHGEDVRAKSANIGQALQKAMLCIEQANPDTLHGISGDAQCGACPLFTQATASPPLTVSSPILRSPRKSGGTTTGSTTPAAANLPGCRQPDPETSPGRCQRRAEALGIREGDHDRPRLPGHGIHNPR